MNAPIDQSETLLKPAEEGSPVRELSSRFSSTALSLLAAMEKPSSGAEKRLVLTDHKYPPLLAWNQVIPLLADPDSRIARCAMAYVSGDE